MLIRICIQKKTLICFSNKTTYFAPVFAVLFNGRNDVFVLTRLQLTFQLFQVKIGVSEYVCNNIIK